MYLNWSIWSPHSLCYSRGVVHGITKPEHKVSNISYFNSFWCSQWPPPPACCPCYWAPWCPAGWCSGGLTVTSTALASWTLLAGSCLSHFSSHITRLEGVQVQVTLSSSPPQWTWGLSTSHFPSCLPTQSTISPSMASRERFDQD